MDSRLYPQGSGGLKSRYVDGVLTFFNTSGDTVYSIDPANRTLTVPAGSSLDQNGRLDFSGIDINASHTDGGVVKAGTSSARVIQDTANLKFMSFYFDNGATSGAAEGLYLRTYATGAGLATLNAARFFATVEDVAIGTARGAHISLSFGASGTVTGLGVALEATLHIPDDAAQAGTLAAIKAAINSDGATSDPAGAQLSFFRVDNQGNATGMADVDTDAYLFDLQGFTAGSGKLVKTGNDVAAAATLKIRVGGTEYFLLLGATEAG